MVVGKLPDGMIDASFEIVIRVQQYVSDTDRPHVNAERVRQEARCAVLEELQRQAQGAIDSGLLDMPIAPDAE
jgi:hypothetical protein